MVKEFREFILRGSRVDLAVAVVIGTAFTALREYGHQYEGTTFLEVGANFGVYCLPAVSELGFARAVAYEPDPASFDLLEQNIDRNGLGDRVSAHHAALSAQPGELTLSLGTGNAGDNRIVDPESGSSRATVSTGWRPMVAWSVSIRKAVRLAA